MELEDYIKNLLNAWYFANYWLFKTKILLYIATEKDIPKCINGGYALWEER